MKSIVASLVLLLLLISATSSSGKRHHDHDARGRNKPPQSRFANEPAPLRYLVAGMLELGKKLLAGSDEKNFVISPLMAHLSVNIMASQLYQETPVKLHNATKMLTFLSDLVGKDLDELSKPPKVHHRQYREMLKALKHPQPRPGWCVHSYEEKSCGPPDEFILEPWKLVVAQNIDPKEWENSISHMFHMLRWEFEADFRGLYEKRRSGDNWYDLIRKETAEYGKKAGFEHHLMEDDGKESKPGVSMYGAMRLETKWKNMDKVEMSERHKFMGKKSDFFAIQPLKMILDEDHHDSSVVYQIEVRPSMVLTIINRRLPHSFDELQKHYFKDGNLYDLLERAENMNKTNLKIKLPVIDFESHLDLHKALGAMFREEMGEPTEFSMLGAKLKNIIDHNRFDISPAGINRHRLLEEPPASSANRTRYSAYLNNPKLVKPMEWEFLFVLRFMRIPILMGRCAEPNKPKKKSPHPSPGPV